MTSVAVLDYGSGNLRSVQRALERVGASVEVTADPAAVDRADGLVVPGVGAFAACMAGIRAVEGGRLIDRRLSGGRAVLGICVGMQVMFALGQEHGVVTEGLAEWPGTVERLTAEVLPHMGWNTVVPPATSEMFEGIADAYFYFVHSYGVLDWTLAPSDLLRPPAVTWCDYGSPFVAAVENGPLWATQFHPEKSGDAGAALLRNWLEMVAQMAKERARRRAEREAEAAREREKRARERARRERVARGKQALTSLVPDAPRLAPGLLARRRRRRLWAFVAVIVLIQVLTWPFLPSWSARLLVLALCVVAAPIVWVLSFGRL